MLDIVIGVGTVALLYCASIFVAKLVYGTKGLDDYGTAGTFETYFSFVATYAATWCFAVAAVWMFIHVLDGSWSVIPVYVVLGGALAAAAPFVLRHLGLLIEAQK